MATDVYRINHYIINHSNNLPEFDLVSDICDVLIAMLFQQYVIVIIEMDPKHGPSHCTVTAL